MSVRLNLLPDLRQQRLRDQHRRQSATLVAIIVWVVCGGIVLLLALYNGTQKLSISQSSSKITSDKSQLSNISGLSDALTAEQSLEALPALYAQRIYYTKFFAVYGQAQPTDVKIESVSMDSDNTMKIEGTGGSYTSIAKLATALSVDNVTFGPGANSGNTPYFTNVQIVGVSKLNGVVSFSITATVGQEVLNGTNK